MAFIDWTDKHKVGVKKVDDQHQRLFDLLNMLHKATINDEDHSTIASILNELIEYTMFHFQEEEMLFREHDYPNITTHKAVHDGLTEKALGLRQQFNGGNANPSLDILDYFRSWLVDHTTGLDKEMGAHLNSRGVF